jgi:hypothetical protein
VLRGQVVGGLDGLLRLDGEFVPTNCHKNLAIGSWLLALGQKPKAKS